jgi:hypothetical protein
MATQIDGPAGPVSDHRSMITALSLATQNNSLTHRVRDLPTPQFISLLDQITAEFEHFLRAIDMINNESLEIMLEQILEAFTLKIGQILRAERTTIFMVDQEKQELWSKIAQGDGERSARNSGSDGQRHLWLCGHPRAAAEYSRRLCRRSI